MHPETWKVTPENGPRLAGHPHQCFYCGSLLGEDHKLDCVCRKRGVLVQVTITYAIGVPETWTAEQIESHRNHGSWCAQDLVAELEAIGRQSCLCGMAEFKYVGEAAQEDEELAGLKFGGVE